MASPTALIVDDDSAFRDSLALLVQREGFETQAVGSLRDARAALATAAPDVVLLDLTLPDGDGLEWVRSEAGIVGTEVIVITGSTVVDNAVEALRAGALDYLTKPIDRARLGSALMNVGRTRALKRELGGLRGELRDLGRFGRLVGRSKAMLQVYDLVARVAPTDATVLVRGESGTGKELVAETIHRLSSRRDAPLLAVNCGAISPNLTESELFGHERGSFTGADRQRLGLFERAHTGTLFLDEITEMPPELQVKLLRVLETGSVVRVGGAAPIAVDVRIVAATNRDPVEAVRSGQLREDLFYRLNVFPVELPPLRERAGDVEVLAEHFLAALNQEAGTSKRFARAALERMRRHSWPGNVRELANAVQRAFILGDEEIGADGLPEVQPSAPEPSDRLVLHVRIGAPIVEVERRLILATLESVGGDKKQAAALLGISLKTLYNRLNVYAAALGAPVAARPAGDDSGS